MNNEIIISFSMLFGSTIALICSVYILLLSRRSRNIENNDKEVK